MRLGLSHGFWRGVSSVAVHVREANRPWPNNNAISTTLGPGGKAQASWNAKIHLGFDPCLRS